jgi:hypothetical protein
MEYPRLSERLVDDGERPKEPYGSRWRVVAPYEGDSGFSGFIPVLETARVQALIERGEATRAFHIVKHWAS